MLKEEVKQELKKRGIPFKTNLNKPQLLALLEENIASTSTLLPTDHTEPEQQYESELHREQRRRKPEGSGGDPHFSDERGEEIGKTN